MVVVLEVGLGWLEEVVILCVWMDDVIVVVGGLVVVGFVVCVYIIVVYCMLGVLVNV